MYADFSSTRADAASDAKENLESHRPRRALPIDPPDLDDLAPFAIDPEGRVTGTQFTFFEYVFIPATEDQPIPFTINGRVTSMVRVPEPSVAALVAIASFAAAARQARKRIRAVR